MLYQGDVDVSERCRPQFTALFLDRFERKTIIVLLGLVRDMKEAINSTFAVAEQLMPD